MKTSSLLVLAATLFVICSAFAFLKENMPGGQNVIVGSKNYITKELTTEQFNSVAYSGSADIIYRQGSKTKVEVYGSDNLVPLLEAVVKDGTLTMKYKKRMNIRNGKLEIRISSPELNRLTINGSADVKLVNGIQTRGDIKFQINGSGDLNGSKLSCRDFSVAINGSGDVVLTDINSQSCRTAIAGSGDVRLSGKSTNANYSIAGSGDIRAVDLQAEYVTARISGSGDISCYASEKLSARVAGSGNIGYKGNPKEIDIPHKHIHPIR